MEDRVVALRVRLQRSLRTTQSQHEKLHEIHTELERAIAARRHEAIGEWIDRLGEALLSHFDLEHRVVFPILRRMSPASIAVVDGLEAEHSEFLSILQAPSSAPGEIAPALSRIRERIVVHEQTEERLIAEALDQTSE